jgi:hypothetical protein
MEANCSGRTIELRQKCTSTQLKQVEAIPGPITAHETRCPAAG